MGRVVSFLHNCINGPCKGNAQEKLDRKDRRLGSETYCLSIGKEQEKVSFSNKQGSGRGVKEQEMPRIAVEKEEGRYGALEWVKQL